MVTLIQKLRRRLVRMRHAHVHSVADLSQHVRRVRLHGPELEGLTWLPGQKVKLAIPGGKASYTPARVSPEQGWMEIIFHLHHGDGPMANWAAALQGGEAVDVFGPKKSMPTLQHDIDWAIFLGDETALGLAQALIEGLPRGVAVHGAIELDAQDSDAPRQLELPLEPLARQGSYGDVLRGWLDAHTLPEG
ncbi:MAG: siderophore-interacting protein, partial [Myxococcota bacterium]